MLCFVRSPTFIKEWNTPTGGSMKLPLETGGTHNGPAPQSQTRRREQFVPQDQRGARPFHPEQPLPPTQWPSLSFGLLPATPPPLGGRRCPRLLAWPAPLPFGLRMPTAASAHPERTQTVAPPDDNGRRAKVPGGGGGGGTGRNSFGSPVWIPVWEPRPPNEQRPGGSFVDFDRLYVVRCLEICQMAQLKPVLLFAPTCLLLA